MKGVIFTHYLNFVEDRFGLETTELMIDRAELESGASYTSVGTYDYHELVRMLTSLCELTHQDISDLLREFGKSLFGFLAASYPTFIDRAPGAFGLLGQVETYIHVEVLKLYPGAQLPSFEHEMLDSRTMALTYQSERSLADLAEGLILGCFEYYGEEVELSRESIAAEDCQKVRFVLRLGEDP